jgi:hypothetical protein
MLIFPQASNLENTEKVRNKKHGGQYESTYYETAGMSFFLYSFQKNRRAKDQKLFFFFLSFFLFFKRAKEQKSKGATEHQYGSWDR